MRQKKKPVTLEEAVKSLQDKKTLLTERYKTSLGKAYGDNESEQDNVTRFNVKVGKYSLRTRIRNNTVLFHQLIFLYFIMCVCIQGGLKLFSFSDIDGNLVIIVYLLVYYAFKLDYKNSLHHQKK